MTELAPHRNRTLYSDCDRNAARAKHNWRRRAVLARRVNHYRVGEQMDAGDRILTLYSKGELNGDCQRDLFFIDSRDGSTVRFGNDPNQVYCNGQMVGRPGTDAPKSYGYFALAMVNGRSANSPDADEPLLFDAWFIRFSDMKQFRIAESARAVDGPNELDGNQFSAIVWDKNDHPRFVIFDSAAGRITVSKELDLEVRHESEDSAKLVPAPRNKFHSMRPM